MIDDLIARELEYFQPMLERQSLATDVERRVWRNETVKQRIERISLETFSLCGGVIRYGLFEGMRLNCNTWWGMADLGSQCLGLYEKQILDLISHAGPFDTFLDIGAADGYYAIGMLHSQMAKRSICFEISEKGQASIKKNWTLNKRIGKLKIHGEANEASLSEIVPKINGKSLVLIDIEGAEFSLLTPKIITMLKNCEVIIEIHNWVEDFLSKYKTLLTDLNQHFEINVIKNAVQNTESIPLLRSYTDDNRLLVASERRPCLMRFLHLKPR
ncbi:hypothetical protein N9L23_00125 [Alphaproteobacteria bacterium]|nr:hypothetical protein [Alphaproteobacteria bacterium]